MAGIQLGLSGIAAAQPAPFPTPQSFPPVQPVENFGLSGAQRGLALGLPPQSGQQLLGQPTPYAPQEWTLGEAQAQTDRALARIGQANPELARTLAEQSGRTTEDADLPWYKDIMNVAGEVLHATGMDRVLEIIGRPAKLIPEIVMDWGEESVWKNIGDALSGKSTVSWDDVLVEKMGMERSFFTAALGFVGDVATDPLTWITFGAGAVGRRLIGETASLATAKAGLTGGIRAAKTGELLEAGTTELRTLLRQSIRAEDLVKMTDDEVLDAASRILFNETAAGKKLAERASKSIVGRVKSAITGVHPEAAGGAAFSISEGAGQQAMLELTAQMDNVFRASTASGWARVSEEAAQKMGVDKKLVDQMLKGYVQTGTGWGVSKTAYQTGKAAAGSIGGARLRFSIPIIDLRMAGRRLPFVPARADFSLGRRLFGGMSGQVRLMKMVGKGQSGATLDHMHAFWEGGWKGLQAFSKKNGDNVAQMVGKGPRSMFYSTSQQLGNVTKLLTPHAQVLRGGGLASAYASDTATMGRHLQTMVAQEIETVRLADGRVLNPVQTGEVIAKAEAAAGAKAVELGDKLNEYAHLMGGEEGDVAKYFDPRISSARAAGNEQLALQYEAEKARALELRHEIRGIEGADDELIEVWRQVGRNTNNASVGSGVTPDVDLPSSAINDVMDTDVDALAPLSGGTYRSRQVGGDTEINSPDVLTDRGDRGTIGHGLHLSNRGDDAEDWVTGNEVDEVRRLLGDGADPSGIDPVSGRASMFADQEGPNVALSSKLAGRKGTYDEVVDGLDPDEEALFRETLDDTRRKSEALLEQAKRRRLEAEAALAQAEAAADDPIAKIADDADAIIADLDAIDTSRAGMADEAAGVPVTAADTAAEEARLLNEQRSVFKVFRNEFTEMSPGVFKRERSGVKTYVFVENGEVVGFRTANPSKLHATMDPVEDIVNTVVDKAARGRRDDLGGLTIGDTLHDTHWGDQGIDDLEKARRAIGAQSLSADGRRLNRRAVERMRNRLVDQAGGSRATPGTTDQALQDMPPEIRALIEAEEDVIHQADARFAEDPALVITGQRNSIVRDFRKNRQGPADATLPIDPVSEFENRVRPLLEAAAGGDRAALDELLAGMDDEIVGPLKRAMETRPGAIDEQLAMAVEAEFAGRQGYTDMVSHYDDGDDIIVFMKKDGTVPVARVNPRAPHVTTQGTQLRTVTDEAKEAIVGKGKNAEGQRLLDETVRRVARLPRDKAEAEARRILAEKGVNLPPGATLFDSSMTAALHGSADRVASRVATQYTGEAIRHADNLGFTRGGFGAGAVGVARYRTILSEAGRKWAQGITNEHRAALERAENLQEHVIPRLQAAVDEKLQQKLAAEQALLAAKQRMELSRPKAGTPKPKVRIAGEKTPRQIIGEYSKAATIAKQDWARAEKALYQADANLTTAQAEAARALTRSTTERAPLMVALAPAEDAKNMAGMKTLKVPGMDTYAMPAFMAEEFEKAMFGFPKLEGAHLAFRKFNNMWKQFATWLFPGFHIRNIQGAFFNNWLGGVGTRDYFGSRRIMSAMDEMAKGKIDGKWTNMLVKTKDPELIEGLRYADPTGQMFGRNLDELTYGDLALLGEGLNLTSGNGRAFAEAAVRSEVRAKQLRDQAKKAAGKGKGRQYIERVPAAYTRPMRWAGTTTENFFRLAAWQRGLRTGQGVWEARAFTMMRHGDYEDLTDFEYTVVRDLIPFYKWMRTNTPFQIHQLLENPAKLLAVQKGQAALYDIQGLNYEEERKKIPGWMTQGLSIPFGVREGENGEKMFDTVLLDLPFADLYMGGKEFISSFLPTVRPFIENVVGVQSFSGAPLTGKQVQMNPLLAPLAPLLKPLGFIHEGEDGNAYMSDKTQNILGILPLYARFKSWIYADEKSASKRSNAIASAAFGIQLRPVDEQALASDELDFYYSQVLPTMDYLRALQYPLPTTDDIEHMGMTVDTALNALGVAPAAPATTPTAA